MGAASTAIWSFGGELTRRTLGWTGGEVGNLWLAIGLLGLAGGACGHLVQRFGLNGVHGAFLMTLAGANLAVAMATDPATTLIGGGAFGAAYMTLTGVYLLWGVRAMLERPAIGITIGFLAIAAGQVAGAPVFGLLLGTMSPSSAGIAFALLALSACAFSRRPPREMPVSR